MAHLEIAHLTGDRERRELTKQQPVSIGSHKTNDVCIDEEGVELIHCRISWNKNAFEAVAAGVDPIDVNGNLVQRSALKSGDVVRLGSVDITFRTGDEPAAEAASSEGVGLKPLTDELPSFLREEKGPPATAKKPPAPIKPPAATKAPRKPEPVPVSSPIDEVLDDDFEEVDEDEGAGGLSGLAALAAESRVESKPRRGRSERETNEEEESDEQAPASAAATATEEPESARPVMADRLREAMQRRSQRPGQEDTLRSPFVLMLGGGTAVLALLAVTFYFIAGRQTAQAEFDAAADLIAEQKFAQGISAFDQFIALHPKDPLADKAAVERDLAKVDQQIVGAAPSWKPGLEALRDFINTHRDDEDFGERHEAVRSRAGDISLGSATAAGKTFDRSLLAVSEESKTLLTTYQPKDSPATQLLQQIQTVARQSEAAILRHETYESALAEVDAAIKAGQPMLALELRRDLLQRYAEFSGDKKVTEKLQQTLDAERALVKAEQLDRAGETDDPDAAALPTLSLIFNARSRTDSVSVNQAVSVLAKDCCYGIDTMTGEPVWRRVVGLNSPFFPIREPSVPSLILFDTRRQELQRVNADTGALLWRQPIDEPVSGQPLLDEGQIYLTTRGGGLYKIDLQSGSISTRLTFSQEVTGAVPLGDGKHLVVAGNREVVYTLTKQPLECVAVAYLSQKSDSIAAPLLSVGHYVLMAENGNNETCAIRLLNAADPAHIAQLASAEVNGRVLDAPVIRGRDLFVPSTRERVSAFGISDDPGQPPLVPGPSYQSKGDANSAIYLLTGPDSQLWMASSALRKLQLTTEAIEEDPQVVAVGLSSQPLQYLGGTMFNARRRPYSDAVTFTQTNREELTSDWQAVVGARLLACSPSGGDSPALVCVSEAGHAFRVTAREWGAARFYGEAVRLPLAEELKVPLFAIAFGDGQAAVVQGGDEPKLWVLSRLGQVDRSFDLEAAWTAPPAPLGSRFVLPVAGKLQVSSGPGQPQIQEYALPSDQAEGTEWRQVLPVDDNNVIAVTAAGQVLQIRLQMSPRAHLAEVTRIDLGAPVDVLGDAGDGLVAIADAQQRVRIIDPLNLDTKAERALEAPISNDVWISGGSLFVETGADHCHCLDPEDGLNPRWNQPLELSGSSLAGKPLVQGDIVLVARQDGTVQRVDLAGGTVQAEMQAGCTLAGGPVAVADQVFVPSLDGSLVNVTTLLNQAAAPGTN